MHSGCAAVACSHIAYGKIAGRHFDDFDKDVVIVDRELWHLLSPLLICICSANPTKVQVECGIDQSQSSE